MSAGNEAVLAAVQKAQELGKFPRGAEGGAIRHLDVVRPSTIDNYVIRFNGMEIAELAVLGDGSTDLDLEVYDHNGNLIARDVSSIDRCYVRWVPRVTGPFMVKIINLGTTSNAYTLLTN